MHSRKSLLLTGILSCFIAFTFFLSTPLVADVTENFDGWSDASYSTVSTYNHTGVGQWETYNTVCHSQNARSGNAIRFNDDSGENEYLDYLGLDGNGKDNGVGTVSFWYRHWDGDSSTVQFKLQYDNGSGWTDVGSVVTVPNDTTYRQFSYDVNIAGDNIKLRVQSVDDAERLLIDDYTITDYSGGSGSGIPIAIVITNPPTASISVSSATTTYTLKGTNDAIVGVMKWTNSLEGTVHDLTPSGDAWDFSASLSLGDNIITVWGTNDVGTSTFDRVTITRSRPDPPSAFTAGATSQSEVALAWTLNAAGDNIIIARNTSDSFGTPSDSTTYSVNDSLGSATVIYNGSGTSTDDTSLSPNTVYYYKAWSYDASTVYSSGTATESTTTSNIPPPVATVATSIGTTSFNANWNAVSGAASYRLDVSTNGFDGGGSGGGGATDLLISQYVETDSGTAPKGIEVWNVSGSTIDFSSKNLVVEKGVNGGAPSEDVTVSSGTLAAGEVWVIGTSDMIPDTEKTFTFNGDDSLVLKLDGVTQDVIGTPGSDPGSEWSGNGVSTKDQNIQIKSGITEGDTDGWTDPSIRFETVSSNPSGTGGLAGFGTAPSSGGSSGGSTYYVPGYSNRTVNGTSEIVSGLLPGMTYYYRVIALTANSTSDYSNVIITNTLTSASDTPLAIVITNPPTASISVSSATTTYTLKGTNDAIVGVMKWTNSLEGTVHDLTPSGDAWSFSASLSLGDNIITVWGTNDLGTSTFDRVTITRSRPDPPSPFTAGATSQSEVALAWTLNAAGDNIIIARNTSDSFGTPSDSTPYSVNDSLGTATVIYNGSGTSTDDTGLSPNTVYYYKAWSYDANTLYSSATATESTTTSNIPPPVATVATSIGTTSFNANWNAVPGATGYIIDVATNYFGSGGSGGGATDLLISQYIETDSGTIPKGIEVWNVSGSAIDFSSKNLVVEKGANGGTPSTDVTVSSGTLAAGDVWVIGTSDMSPDTTYNFSFNGDDSLVVKLDGVTQDVIGTPNSDPGSAWTGSGVSTADQNIQIKSGITEGDTDGWTDPSIRFETVSTSPSGAGGQDGFGTAPAGGGGGVTYYVSGYSNLYVGNVLTYPVSGLTPGMTYYYRVTAITSSVTSDWSNVISAETTDADAPVVVITNPVANATVYTDTITLSGTNAPSVVGTMFFSNLTTGTEATLAAPGSPYGWSHTFSLAMGANTLTICGTNSSGVWGCDTIIITREEYRPESFISWYFDTPSSDPYSGFGTINYNTISTNWPYSESGGGMSAGGHGLVITEVMIDPNGTESSTADTTEWLELYNTGPDPINLLNFAIGDNSGDYGGLSNAIGDATIEVGEFVCIVPPGRAEGFTSAWQLTNVKVYEPSSQWPNFNNSSGDRIYVSNTVDNVIVDEFTYTSSWPYDPGQSMYLTVNDPAPESNDVSSAWATTANVASNAMPNSGSYGGVYWGPDEYGTPGNGGYKDSNDSFLQVIGSDGWPSSLDYNNYMEFSFNTNMSQVNFYLDVFSTNDGPNAILFQYSIDGTSWIDIGSPISFTADTWHSVTCIPTGVDFEPGGGIRILGYGGTSTSGELWLDNIYGTGIPEPGFFIVLIATGMLWLRRK